ncbi:MAG: tRNA lysidine(34) synthetase TilS [Phycisphaerae bacterium]
MPNRSAEQPADVPDQLRIALEPMALRAGDAIVLAVSGGCDSVALLAAMDRLARPRRWRLMVAHLDHAIREESAADAAFVRQLAEDRDLEFVGRRIDVPEQARQDGVSLETAAREARYRFLLETAERSSARFVATGQHADDQVETVLFRIARGTHLRGLRGIRPARPLSETVTLIRPLLALRRAELEAFCRQQGLTWREDPTNRHTDHARNALRHEILPALREAINPSADEALLRLAEAAAEVADVLDRQTEQLLNQATIRAADSTCLLDARVLADADPAIGNSAVRAAMERAGVGLQHVTREMIRDVARLARTGAGAVSLPEGFEARCRAGQLCIGPPPSPTDVPDLEVRLNCPGRTELPDGRTVELEPRPFDAGSFERHCRNPEPGVEWLDADRLSGSLRVRPRRDGDRFRPLGAPGSKTVSDFLTDLRLPVEDRRKAFCILDDGGIVYLLGLRLADRAAVRDDTQRVLILKVHHK